MEQDKTELENLHYDVFVRRLINFLKPRDVKNLCDSSKTLKARCTKNNNLVYRLVAEKYLINYYIEVQKILPYLSTTIWDNKINQYKAHRNIRSQYKNVIDFVVPDIIFEIFAKRMKMTLKQLEQFFFTNETISSFTEADFTCPLSYHFGVTIEESEHKNYLLLMNGKGGKIPVIIENDIPILIDNSVKCIGELKPYPKFESNRRFLINGIILQTKFSTEVMNNIKILSTLLVGATIKFFKNDFEVNRNGFISEFKTENKIFMKAEYLNESYDVLNVQNKYPLLIIGVSNKSMKMEVPIQGKLTMNGEVYWS